MAKRNVREDALRAVYKVCSQVGPENLSTKKLSEEIHASEAMIYYHFKNKQAILEEAYTACGAAIRQPMGCCSVLGTEQQTLTRKTKRRTPHKQQITMSRVKKNIFILLLTALMLLAAGVAALFAGGKTQPAEAAELQTNT